MLRMVMFGLALFAASLLAAPRGLAVEVGDPAPAFSGMGVDDKPYSLDSFKDAKAVVVIFTCNHCPWAKAYEETFKELQSKFGPQGAPVVAICVNAKEGDKLPGMKKRAEKEDLNYVYVYDESQQSALDYGAANTPHVFVVDADRNIAYVGAPDDAASHQQAGARENIEEHYLADAIEAVLAGKAVPIPKTMQRGCTIKWTDESKAKLKQKKAS